MYVAGFIGTGWKRYALFAGLLSLLSAAVDAKTLRVGKEQQYKTIAEASMAAVDGDVVEIEAGQYSGDVAVWTQKRLRIVGVNGMAVLSADGRSAEGKAIWVFKNGDYTVENIEFRGVRVPDRNGAGIRFEKGKLLVRNCIFRNSENGLLSSNDPASELEIESSEFGHNGTADGQAHDLYVGQMKRLRVTGSYFHHGKGGHLLKSRASENYIFYNRLTDEPGGQASYELELPAGGVSYVVGNLIEQSSTTENPHLVSYGTEGYAWPRNELYLINNTLVDNRPDNGVFLRVKPGAHYVRAANNILIGKGQIESAAVGDFRGNYNVGWSDVALVQRQDYRLKITSPLVGKAIDPGFANGINLRPTKEYVHPRLVRPVAMGSPGAMQSLAQ